jgi:hypothetical protein
MEGNGLIGIEHADPLSRGVRVCTVAAVARRV